MLAVMLVLGTALESQAVECSNGGAGNDPAGIDGGGNFNTACGDGANASGAGSSRNIALGGAADARGDDSFNTAIGYFARARGGHSISIGRIAKANATLGGAPTGFDNAIAVGDEAFAPHNNAIAVGTRSEATKALAIAIGRAAVATKPRSVAIGSNSVADEPDTVSVGRQGNRRRIMHVARAIKGSDAVNFNQVKQLIANAIAASQGAPAALRPTPPAVSVVPVGPAGAGNAIGKLQRELAELRALVERQQQRIAQLESRSAAATSARGE